MDGTEAIARLRRELRLLRMLVAILVLALAGAAVFCMVRGPGVLRARGLVIVDAQGRDRILLGAPTPASRDRRRTGAESDALVILGPDGADRILVGQSPQPIVQGHVAQRIAEAWGLVLHDPRGNERGGMGFLGDSRAAIALDYPQHDAIGMVVDDKSHSARLMLAYPPEAHVPEAAAELVAEKGSAQLRFHDVAGRPAGAMPDGK